MVPGGIGTLRDVDNQRLLDFIAECAAEVQLTTSVCTGSAILANAGVPTASRRQATGVLQLPRRLRSEGRLGRGSSLGRRRPCDDLLRRLRRQRHESSGRCPILRSGHREAARAGDRIRVERGRWAGSVCWEPEYGDVLLGGLEPAVKESSGLGPEWSALRPASACPWDEGVLYSHRGCVPRRVPEFSDMKILCAYSSCARFCPTSL